VHFTDQYGKWIIFVDCKWELVNVKEASNVYTAKRKEIKLTVPFD
jgi:hypothetical protein